MKNRGHFTHWNERINRLRALVTLRQHSRMRTSVRTDLNLAVCCDISGLAKTAGSFDSMALAFPSSAPRRLSAVMPLPQVSLRRSWSNATDKPGSFDPVPTHGRSVMGVDL